jgi:hypothetical protein
MNFHEPQKLVSLSAATWLNERLRTFDWYFSK